MATARNPNDDRLADLSAKEVLRVLETPINGKPSVQILNYATAHRLVKAALLAVWESKQEPESTP